MVGDRSEMGQPHRRDAQMPDGSAQRFPGSRAWFLAAGFGQHGGDRPAPVAGMVMTCHARRRADWAAAVAKLLAALLSLLG